MTFTGEIIDLLITLSLIGVPVGVAAILIPVGRALAERFRADGDSACRPELETRIAALEGEVRVSTRELAAMQAQLRGRDLTP